MAYQQLSLDKYKETASLITRLKEFKKPLTFSEKISLAKLEEANESYKTAVIDKNTTLSSLDEKTDAVNTTSDNLDWVLAKLRLSEGIASDNESDIYVVLGGTRQSEIVAKQQQTIADKKKVAEAKKKVDVETDKNPPK